MILATEDQFHTESNWVSDDSDYSNTKHSESLNFYTMCITIPSPASPVFLLLCSALPNLHNGISISP